MRSNLKDNVEQLVLVEGTITSWSNNSKYRDLVINDVTVKLHDTNLKPIHQKVISKEDHLHIFIKQEDIEDYSQFINFKLYTDIQFVGVVNQYKRQNGTSDYGVFIIKQSKTTTEIAKCIKKANLYRIRTCKMKAKQFYRERVNEENLRYLNTYLIPKMERLYRQLETDTRVINFGIPVASLKMKVRRVVDDLKEDTTFFANVAINSRRVRRMKKGSESPLLNLLPQQKVLSGSGGFG